jgi:hypothetical protein
MFPRGAIADPLGRENSDEVYVLALCDSVLDEIGLRQHEFDWLRGDASETGRQVRLPVDGYWPKAIELAPLVGVKATAPPAR